MKTAIPRPMRPCQSYVRNLPRKVTRYRVLGHERNKSESGKYPGFSLSTLESQVLYQRPSMRGICNHEELLFSVSSLVLRVGSSRRCESIVLIRVPVQDGFNPIEEL